MKRKNDLDDPWVRLGLAMFFGALIASLVLAIAISHHGAYP